MGKKYPLFQHIMPKINGQKKIPSAWSGIPPWIIIGAVAILFPIFAFLTIQNINREKEYSTQLLVEKGAALIRAFEAGTRTGMMGMMHRGNFRLQMLLTETAQQPDIAYLLVTDRTGTILAHNNPDEIGSKYGINLDLDRIAQSTAEAWREVQLSKEAKAFEIFRKFEPSAPGPPGGMHSRGRMMRSRPLQRHHDPFLTDQESDQIIFIGLTMDAVEQARQADTRHTIIMSMVLLLIGFAGIIFLFLSQRYRETKASLSQVQALSDNLVENAPIGLIALDTANQILSLNQVAGNILKLAPQHVVGKDAANLLPKALLNLTASPEIASRAISCEIECAVSADHIMPLDVIASMLRDEEGAFLGYVLLLKDLSEIKILQKEIARTQRLATVGRLAAGVAHEIRNPLSSIKGFATFFKERYHNNPQDKQTADIMIQEVDRLNRVVGQLLEFARPIQLVKQKTKPQALIQDALTLIQAQARAKDIDIQTEYIPNNRSIRVDADRMRQVLLNLFINAMEAMDSGGRLSVSVKPHNEHNLAIAIADTGHGIAAKDLGNIFDPYFTTKAAGTGLGLAIVHNIVQAHGGKILADSDISKGTTITLILPANEASKEDNDNQTTRAGR